MIHVKLFENRPFWHWLHTACGTYQRPPRTGFLVLFHDGTPLPWDHLCQELRLTLQATGVDASGYSGHSFRIGAAIAAAQVGLSDSHPDSWSLGWQYSWIIMAQIRQLLRAFQPSWLTVHHKYIWPGRNSFHLTGITTLISVLLLFGFQRCSTSICVVVM